MRKTALLLAGSADREAATPVVVRQDVYSRRRQPPADAGGRCAGIVHRLARFAELLQAAQAVEDGFVVLDQLGAAIAATDAAQRNRVLTTAFELTDEQSVADACAADLLDLQWADIKEPHRLLQLFALLNLSRMLGTPPRS